MFRFIWYSIWYIIIISLIVRSYCNTGQISIFFRKKPNVPWRLKFVFKYFSAIVFSNKILIINIFRYLFTNYWRIANNDWMMCSFSLLSYQKSGGLRACDKLRSRQKMAFGDTDAADETKGYSSSSCYSNSRTGPK